MAKPSLVVKISTKAGKRDELVTAFKPMFEQVNAEAGTEVYVLSLDQGDENAVWVYEVYADQEAMDSHSGSEAMAELMGGLGDLIDPDVAPLFNMVTPVLAKGVSL